MKVLNSEQKHQFENEGYLVVPDFLDLEKDIQPVMDELDVVLDNLANRLKAEGTIQAIHRGVPFNERMLQICVESGQTFGQQFDFSLPQSGITRQTPIHTGPAIFRMLTNPRLLDVVEDLIGPEIFSNPVQHVRMKLPARAVPRGFNSYHTTRVPWHQDNGVIMPDADDATILTVWFPLTDATIENGCMQVLPESHRQGMAHHCLTPAGVAIPDSKIAVEKAIALPMTAGSLLLMTQRTKHASLDNITDNDMRISMDLRYQPVGQPTGREAFAPAGFIARSMSHPETELHDPVEWTRRWEQVRDSLSGQERIFNRWVAGAAGCA